MRLMHQNPAEGGGGGRNAAMIAIIDVARETGILDRAAPRKRAEPQDLADQQMAEKKAAERKVFAKFGDDFDTFRDAASVRVSAEEEKAMRAAIETILARVEAKRKALKAGGKEADLDELAKEFEHIPRNFMPIQFKKELQDWRAARDAMQDRNVRKMFEGTDLLETGKGAVEIFSTVVSLGETGNEKLGEKFFDPKKAKLAGDVLKDLGFVAEGVSATLGMAKGLKGMAEAEGPVQKKMASDEALEGLKSLAGTGMDIGAEFVPLVGALKDGATYLARLKDIYEHIELEVQTGKLKDKAALEVFSQLAKAFGQEEKRRGDLQQKAGVDAVSNAMTAAGKALTSTVVAAKVGAPLTIIGKTIGIGNAIYFKNVDWNAAEKAQKVLAEARAGNEQAMQEVFANHAAYAKMLIALYAKKKNPLAIKYFVQRGLTEDDLNDKATSMDILMEFGLKKSEEEEDAKTFGQTLADGLEKAAAVAETVGKGIKALLVKVGAMQDTPPEKLVGSPPDLGVTRAYRKDEIAAMVETLKKSRRALAEGSTAPYLSRNIDRLTTVLKELKSDTEQLYQRLMNSKVGLAKIEAQWVAEAHEIKKSGKQPAIQALDPTPLIPLVRDLMAKMQVEIEAAKEAYEVVTRAPLD